MLARQNRRRLAGERRQVFHVVVKGRELSVPGILQHKVEPMFLGLAGEKGNAERLRLHHFGRHLVEHRNATRHVKAADAHRKPAGDKGPCQIDGPRELVRLHADQPDQRAAALFLDHAHDPAGADAPVGLVIGVEAEVDTGAEDLTAPRVFGERKQAGQRVGGNGRTHPLDGVAVVVIMRRLDHDEMKRFRAL